MDRILVSTATIMVLLGMEVHFKQYLFKFAIPLMIAGVVILVLGKRIIKDFQTNFLKRFTTNSTGILLLVVGIEYFLEQHIEAYWVMFLIVGLLLFQYHKTISDKLRG